MNSAIPSRRTAFLFAFLALVLVSFSAATSYIAYDVIAPIGRILKLPVVEGGLALTETQVNLLYSMYSVPVILFVVLGGILADKLGVRKAGIIFAACFALGAVFTAAANYPLMIIGRILLGIGAEAFYVVMNKILAKWFKDKILATAFGVNLFLCRAGTILSFWGTPRMVEAIGSWRIALWIVAVVCLTSILAMIVYLFIDRQGESRGMTAIVEEGSEEFVLRDALRLPPAFWVISGLCMIYYSAIFPFTAIAPRFFSERYGMDDVAANDLALLITLISMFTTWFFGLIVDRFGKRATLMIFGSLMMIPCHVLMVTTDISPYIPMIALGISFSLVPAALWPAIPLMVKDRQLGTAFGVIAMVQNIGLFSFPLLAGFLRDYSGDYTSTMWMFSGCGTAGLLFAIWLKIIEKKHGSYLDSKIA